MTEELDVRGLNCPLPVVKTKKALEAMPQGDLDVITERAEGCQNVQRFAESQGCRVSVEEKEGLFYVHIHKEKPAETASPPLADIVVFITTDQMGTGNRQLGEILMKAFLNTLWDADPKPTKMLFMNSGVKLTTQGSDVLDSLKLLEEAGVEIFSCGTCLEFYNLSDQLQVGRTTNMYHTVDSLLSTGRVIKI